jgi:hypothetical protein
MRQRDLLRASHPECSPTGAASRNLVGRRAARQRRDPPRPGLGRQLRQRRSNYTGFDLSRDGRLRPIPGSTVALPNGSSQADVRFNGAEPSLRPLQAADLLHDVVDSGKGLRCRGVLDDEATFMPTRLTSHLADRARRANTTKEHYT